MKRRCFAEAGCALRHHPRIWKISTKDFDGKQTLAIGHGANDVVNRLTPPPRTRKSQPDLRGMPILNVRNICAPIRPTVIKRGQGKGYSRRERNELFYADNTSMVYGDAQKGHGADDEAVKVAGAKPQRQATSLKLQG